jgi:hypothetical protein
VAVLVAKAIAQTASPLCDALRTPMIANAHDGLCPHAVNNAEFVRGYCVGLLRFTVDHA